jgi:hypothetical protein
MRPWRSGGQARMTRLSRGAGASAAREAREEREEHGQKGVHAETGGQVSMAGDDTELRRRQWSSVIWGYTSSLGDVQTAVGIGGDADDGRRLVCRVTEASRGTLPE